MCPRTQYTNGKAYWYHRLREGLQDKIGLVLAEAAPGLEREPAGHRNVICDAALFGARYLAAYSPTERTQLQTAMVARLSRGDALYEEREDATSP